ncbi:MAG: response regulator transcription factor [Acidobacteriota bacterium]
MDFASSILVFESRALVAAALRQVLETRASVTCRDPADSTLEAAIATLEPDVLVVHGADSTPDELRAVREAFAELRLVVYGDATDKTSVREFLDVGVDAYLTSDAAPAEFGFAIDQVLDGNAYLAPAVVRDVMRDAVGRDAVGREPARLATAAPVSETEPGTAEAIRVLVVDDHPMIRLGIQALLDATPGLEVVGIAADGVAAIERAAALRPDVVLMDVVMPELDGVEATRSILRSRGDVAVVVMSALAGEELLLEAVRAGAVGFVSKRFEPDEIEAAIRAAHNGRTFLNREVTRSLLELPSPSANPPASLTAREREIARWVAEGLSNRDIALRAVVSEGTVRSHLRNIFEKIDISNRVELALYALRSGWATLDP